MQFKGVNRNMENKKEQITLYLPPELKEQLRQEAANKGYTVKDLLIILLTEYFEKASTRE